MKSGRVLMILVLCGLVVCLAAPALAENETQIDPATQLYNQGTTLVSTGEYANAIIVLDQALASNTTMLSKGDVLAYIYRNKAFAQIQLDKFEDAIKTIDQGLALYPKDALLLNNKGYSLYRLGRYDDALAAYNTAIGFDKTYTKALVNKGDVLQKLGRCGEAVDAYSAALATEKDNMDAAKGLAQTKQCASSATMTMIVILVIVIAAVGLIVYVVKFRKPAGGKEIDGKKREIKK